MAEYGANAKSRLSTLWPNHDPDYRFVFISAALPLHRGCRHRCRCTATFSVCAFEKRKSQTDEYIAINVSMWVCVQCTDGKLSKMRDRLRRKACISRPIIITVRSYNNDDALHSNSHNFNDLATMYFMHFTIHDMIFGLRSNATKGITEFREARKRYAFTRYANEYIIYRVRRIQVLFLLHNFRSKSTYFYNVHCAQMPQLCFSVTSSCFRKIVTSTLFSFLHANRTEKCVFLWLCRVHCLIFHYYISVYFNSGGNGIGWQHWDGSHKHANRH